MCCQTEMIKPTWSCACLCTARMRKCLPVTCLGSQRLHQKPMPTCSRCAKLLLSRFSPQSMPPCLPGACMAEQNASTHAWWCLAGETDCEEGPLASRQLQDQPRACPEERLHSAPQRHCSFCVAAFPAGRQCPHCGEPVTAPVAQSDRRLNLALS